MQTLFKQIRTLLIIKNLPSYGLEDSVKDINVAGVKLAKQAAKDQAYVVGTLGKKFVLSKKTLLV